MRGALGLVGFVFATEFLVDFLRDLEELEFVEVPGSGRREVWMKTGTSVG